MKEQIRFFSTDYFSRLSTIRRAIHQNPELSGCEKETASLICQVLKQLSIPYQSQFSGYGVVACIKGTKKQTTSPKVVAIRADMDALPIQEENSCYYHSKNRNVMHACGHDFHIASVLGTLLIINKLKDTFSGTVKFIFQPSEEEYAGGAKFMIGNGVLENPRPDYIFGIHADPAYPCGQIAFHEGPFMASTDELHFHLRGKGGHAALVKELHNPIIAGSRMILRLLKETDALKPTATPFVLNFGKFLATGTNNIVPDKVEIAGTLRMFDETLRPQILQMIEETALEECASAGVVCNPEIRKGYPNLVNDVQTTRMAKQLAVDYLGAQNVLEAPLRCTAEDFSYYLQKIPGTFIRVGIANNAIGITHNLHTSQFDVDDEALKYSVGYLAYLAINILVNNL